MYKSKAMFVNSFSQLARLSRSLDVAQAFYDLAQRRSWRVAREPGCFDIVYLEGVNLDYTPNTDSIDKFNDLGLLVTVDKMGVPFVALAHQATTAPGLASINSPGAAQLGGVARIMLGEHWERWVLDWHKHNPQHPALCCRDGMLVHRDLNKDGKREGDKTSMAYGINQHGTRAGWEADKVGTWSAGCLVRRYFTQQLHFINTLKTDKRFSPNAKTPRRWSTWVCEGKELEPVLV